VRSLAAPLDEPTGHRQVFDLADTHPAGDRFADKIVFAKNCQVLAAGELKDHRLGDAHFTDE
jgi:hypothetical protein